MPYRSGKRLSVVFEKNWGISTFDVSPQCIATYPIPISIEVIPHFVFIITLCGKWLTQWQSASSSSHRPLTSLQPSGLDCVTVYGSSWGPGWPSAPNHINQLLLRTYCTIADISDRLEGRIFISCHCNNYEYCHHAYLNMNNISSYRSESAIWPNE